jgi:hypothetical protein
MGIGVSIFLLAVGAILAFAVDVQANGIDLNAVGVILMVVGVIGLLTSLMFWDRMGFGGGVSRRTVARDYVDDGLVTTAAPRRTVRRTVVRDDDLL